MSLTENVCAIVGTNTGQDVTAESSLDTLKGDSLDFLELLFQIEDATGKRVPTEKIGGLHTVGDIIEALC